MKEVFVDSFYFIAMINPADRHHEVATSVAASFKRPVVTTIWVLMEVADGLSAPWLRTRTHGFMTSMSAHKRLTVITDLEPWFSRGLNLYGHRPDKDWSLTDCISFEVMKERGIAEALTGDRHFIQAGFQTLLSLADS